MKIKARIMDGAEMHRALLRIAHAIIEDAKGAENLALVGIHRRGVPLAHRLAAMIGDIEAPLPSLATAGGSAAILSPPPVRAAVPVGTLDITLYRDDLSLLAEHPQVNGTDILFNVAEKHIVLVDDVLSTGRTVRAAVEAIMDIGRPPCIRLAVLCDRPPRELPIHADFVGRTVPCSRNEFVQVLLRETDGPDEVVIAER